MATETITLEVDSEAAQAFKSVSADEREKLQVLLSVWLKKYATTDTGSLKEIMDEMSEEAQSRGLTPEILKSILEEE
jgi:hypothetical protein